MIEPWAILLCICEKSFILYLFLPSSGKRFSSLKNIIYTSHTSIRFCNSICAACQRCFKVSASSPIASGRFESGRQSVLYFRYVSSVVDNSSNSPPIGYNSDCFSRNFSKKVSRFAGDSRSTMTHPTRPLRGKAV